jgi:hypothetical protein
MDLTRRLIDEDHQTWAIMCADVRVGAISKRSGAPRHVPQWRWDCGFYPGIEPGQHQEGVAETFEEARSEFQVAWERLQSVMAADALDRYRKWWEGDQRRWQLIREGWKPPQWAGEMTCACGTRFNSWVPAQSQEHCPHIYAAQAAGTWARSA